MGRCVCGCRFGLVGPLFAGVFWKKKKKKKRITTTTKTKIKTKKIIEETFGYVRIVMNTKSSDVYIYFVTWLANDGNRGGLSCCLVAATIFCVRSWTCCWIIRAISCSSSRVASVYGESLFRLRKLTASVSYAKIIRTISGLFRCTASWRQQKPVEFWATNQEKKKESKEMSAIKVIVAISVYVYLKSLSLLVCRPSIESLHERAVCFAHSLALEPDNASHSSRYLS